VHQRKTKKSVKRPKLHQGFWLQCRQGPFLDSPHHFFCVLKLLTQLVSVNNFSTKEVEKTGKKQPLSAREAKTVNSDSEFGVCAGAPRNTRALKALDFMHKQNDRFSAQSNEQNAVTREGS